MFLKLLTIDIFIPGCSSLKEKRYVLSSLKAKLRQRYNVTVSEVDYQDKWQRSKLAVATVGPDRKVVDSSCEKVMKLIEGDHRTEILDFIQEIR